MYKNIKKLYALLIKNKVFNQNINLFLHPYREVNVHIPKLDLVYISISKTGISSIRSILLDRVGIEHNKEEYVYVHIKTGQHFQYIPLKEIVNNKSAFKFSFVRNPFDRLVSCYKNKLLDEDYPPIQNYYGPLFYKGMSFEKFIKNVCFLPDLLSDRHFRSQYSYLYFKGELVVDFLGKFESLNEDFNAIKKRYDLGDLPHINSSKDKKKYQDYYTPELVTLVYKRYKNDIEKFNYQTEYQALKEYVENLNSCS